MLTANSPRGVLAAFACVIFVSGIQPARAQTWAPTSAPVTNWVSIAASANGSNVFAAARGADYYHDPAPIFRSTNAGLSWTQTTAPVAFWTSIASSADGTNLFASVGYQQDNRSTLYMSADAGTTWSETSLADSVTALNIVAVACSADGKIAFALSGLASGEFYGSQLFTSTNSGLNWFSAGLDGYAMSLTCSADGTKIAGGFISPWGGWSLISTNLGGSWYRGVGGQSVACSADGVKLLVSSDWGGPRPISLSADSGITWNQVTNPPLLATIVASSAEGTRLFASGGPMFTSTDSGANWTQVGVPMTNSGLVVCSADGNRMFAAAANWPSGALIDTAQLTPAPALSILYSGTNVKISWLVPSLNFALQQTRSLDFPVWSDVSATPLLNYTNLHYEATVPATPNPAFYRLVSR